MDAKPRRILIYEKGSGARPFVDWLDSLLGQTIHGIVLTRLDRVEKGNFGDCHSLGGGISELRIDVGPGYRVYFGLDGELVILLGGGIKRTQKRDIARAKECWRDYHA